MPRRRLLAIREVGLPNLGVTLDFAHVLYADEQPAFAAALVARHSGCSACISTTATPSATTG